MRIKILLILFIVVSVKCDCNKEKTTIARLKEDILCGYEKTTRPIKDIKNATNVLLKMILKSVSYEHGRLSVGSWMAIIWKDAHLTWNPSDYDDINMVQISSDSIWKPDLSIYNMPTPGDPYTSLSVDCLLRNNGQVVCISPGTHDAICMPNILLFPFDVQNCTLRLGSWVHSGEELNFRFSNPAVTLEDYIEGGEWELLKVNASKHEGKFKCCPNNTYPTLNYNFLLRRHSGIHVIVSLIPGIVMFVMTLFALCINPSMERTAVNCANIINHFLYLEYMFWQIPLSGPQKPLVFIYARDSLIILTYCLILTALERHLLTRTAPTPYWITRIVTTVTNSRIAQYIFIYNNNLKVMSEHSSDEDSSNIIQNAEQSNKDWKMLATIINKLSFIIILIIYFCMFIAFIP